ncbi:MAG: glycoside hydrolase domain-containing protein [Planctomycetota bacterium]
MLFAIHGSDGSAILRGPIPSGTSLVFPVECPPRGEAVYYVYFDNPEAWEVPDVFSVRLGVANGDLEEGEGDAPAGWSHDPPDEGHRASWVSERPKSGKRCLETAVSPGAEPTWISTRQAGIAIAGGARYRMTGWVRAERVEGYAGWYIHVGNEKNSMLVAPILNGGGGSYDWKQVSTEVVAPPEADRASLGTVLRGTGIAWFDDVRLERLDPGGLSASAGALERMELEEVGRSEWAAAASGAERRAVFRSFSPDARPSGPALVALDAAALLGRGGGRGRARLAVFDGDAEIPRRVLGDLVLFEGSLPARSARTWYVYLFRERREPAEPRPQEADAGSLRLNLVRNPSFESGGMPPAGWTHDATPPGVSYSLDDPGRADFGRRCAKMVVGAPAPEAWRGWHQSVAVEPGGTYLVSCWMRCRGLEGEARLHAHRYTAAGTLSAEEPMTSVGPGVRGTSDWTLQYGLVRMPEDTTRLDLHLTVNVRGTLWHDEVIVAKVSRAPLAGIEGRPLGPSEPVALWQVPAIVKVFEDDPPGPPAEALQISSARGEDEPIQAAVRSGRAVAGVRVEVDPPLGPLGRKLDVEVGVVGYVPIDHPTNYYQSRAPAWHRKIPASAGACDGWPGRWPDPIFPRAAFDLRANVTQPVWITVRAPRDAPPGDYRGRLRLRSGGETLAERPIRVRVWDFALPEETHVGAVYDVRITGGGKFWGMPSEEAEREIARFMARKRLCPDCVRPFPKIRCEGGQVSADFADFDRAARWYFEELKVPFSYTPWYFYLFGWGFPPGEKFGQEPYPGSFPYEGADRSQLRPEFKKAYQACLRTFWDHVKAMGWEKKFILYISDEPFDAQAPIREQMKALCRMIREVDPAIPIYVSTWKHVPDWDGCVTVWGIGHYGIVAPETMARIRSGGARIWFTTDGQMCIDTPYCAVERLLPHYCFRYGADAYEFWGVSWYTYDPFRCGWHAYIHQSDQPGVSYWVRYPNGDGFLVYPGAPAGVRGPISSLRLEAARDGVEDYEFLYLLRARIDEAERSGRDVSQARAALSEAAALVAIPNAGGRYSTRILPDPEALYAAREKLAEAIEGLAREAQPKR